MFEKLNWMNCGKQNILNLFIKTKWDDRL